MSDPELLQQYARENSQTAFTTLVERHVNLVYSAARRQVRSPELTEEIVQSVFIVLSQQATKLPRAQPLAAWLYVVTRRTAINVVRRETRRQARETTAAEIETMKDPSPTWSRVEESLDEAMETLNDTERSAIVLRFFENLPLREVGAALGISEDTAQKRVSRALDRLRGFFARRGMAVAATALATDLSAHAVQAAPAGIATVVATKALSSSGLTTGLAQIMAAKTAFVLGGVATIVALGTTGWAWHRMQLNPASTPVDRPPTFPAMKPKIASAATPLTPPLTGSSRTASASPLDDPAFRQAVAQESRARLDRFYAPLFGRLKLSDGKLDRLKDMIVEKQFVRADAARSVNDEGVTRKDDAEKFFEVVRLAERDIDDRLKALLGETDYQNYIEYDRSLGKRLTVERFREALAHVEPLTDEQSDKLIQVMVVAGSPADGDAVGLSLLRATGMSRPNHAAIHADTIRAAKDFLSPTQWRALKELREQIRSERGRDPSENIKP